jgi:Ferroportin1 (FPN1)
MRLVSANQLIDGFSSILLSTYVGNWLDRHDRRVGALAVLLLNNLCVGLSAALLAACLSIREGLGLEGGIWSLLYGLALVLSIVSCALSRCASEGQRLVLTKDWIVVMERSRGGAEEESSLSSQFKWIDLDLSPILPPSSTVQAATQR